MGQTEHQHFSIDHHLTSEDKQLKIVFIFKHWCKAFARYFENATKFRAAIAKQTSDIVVKKTIVELLQNLSAYLQLEAELNYELSLVGDGNYCAEIRTWWNLYVNKERINHELQNVVAAEHIKKHAKLINDTIVKEKLNNKYYCAVDVINNFCKNKLTNEEKQILVESTAGYAAAQDVYLTLIADPVKEKHSAKDNSKKSIYETCAITLADLLHQATESIHTRAKLAGYVSNVDQALNELQANENDLKNLFTNLNILQPILALIKKKKYRSYNKEIQLFINKDEIQVNDDKQEKVALNSRKCADFFSFYSNIKNYLPPATEIPKDFLNYNNKLFLSNINQTLSKKGISCKPHSLIFVWIDIFYNIWKAILNTNDQTEDKLIVSRVFFEIISYLSSTAQIKQWLEQQVISGAEFTTKTITEKYVEIVKQNSKFTSSPKNKLASSKKESSFGVFGINDLYEPGVNATLTLIGICFGTFIAFNEHGLITPEKGKYQNYRNFKLDITHDCLTEIWNLVRGDNFWKQLNNGFYKLFNLG